MDVDQFLTSVFPSKERDEIATPRRLLEYSSLQEHIDDILSKYEEKPKAVLDPEQRAITDGRIGPEVVKIDRSSLCGSMNIKDATELESQSNFSSARANICVCKGKWMYEILLGSKGIMQLGWATLGCKFTNEEGVGDTADSFAYDGHRVRKWNVSTAKYGEEWMAGDVIGCAIDLDEGTISYSRNGKHLGVAFDNVRFGPGFAYFPAVSLSYGESCHLNFGAYPFKFPMEYMNPMQDPPLSDVAKGTELTDCLERLFPAPDRIAKLPPALHCKSNVLSLLTTSHVFEKLGPLLTKGYVVEKVLLPYLLRSCSDCEPLADQPGVTNTLDLMWACMEDFELEPCLEHLLFALIKAYWYQPVTMDFKTQTHCLKLALSILKHNMTRHALIQCKIFPQKFSYFMHIRPPDDNILNSAFPVVWWESDDVNSCPSESDKVEYMGTSQSLKDKVEVLEVIQVEMCKILMCDDDQDLQGGKSTRVMFLNKFRKYLQDNMLTTLTLQPSTACAGPVITCFYHRLIQALRFHWDQTAAEQPEGAITSQEAYVPLHVFFDDTIQYWDTSRLGGVLSHVKRAYDSKAKEELSKRKTASTSSDSVAAQDMSVDLSLVRMLDDVIMLYHIAVHKQLSKVRAVRDSMQQNIKALEDTHARIARCGPERKDVLAELNRSKRVFTEETTHCARHMAWVSTLIFTKKKQEDIHWMLCCILNTITRAAERGPLFEFTPEFYLDVAINAFHGLRNYFHPTVKFTELPDTDKALCRMAALLSNHFADSRIINPDLRDQIIQALAAFVCYPDSLQALESMPTPLLEKTVRSLMGAYEKRSWVQTTWILVRIWKGCGFAFRYTSSQDIFTIGLPEQAPCPSKVIQELIASVCVSDVKLGDEFLNGVLNQLNWAFSEFIGMLQEIQQATNRMEITLETRQLRTCAVCFDLTVGLLRVLEMVSTLAPEVFTDWKQQSTELHIARLFQLLTQVLNRITASSNLFENVTRLHLPGLETVDRFPILGAVAGILLALLSRGSDESRERATSALLAEPGFTLESVEFLVGSKSAIPGKVSSASFSFATVHKDVVEDEVRQLDALVSYLDEQSSQMRLLQKQESVDVDELCPICCAMRISVRFLPCRHVSCRSCITRHLMNNKECFFCKEVVDTLAEISADDQAIKK
ncbi:E3 ubiquitin-protein ligase RNF123 isoform X2 [Nematostella vectensis]|uniref:E3 ubiquitin-protein ligase RNF123 isoform X2 n=1 Tax=Nematostella vectensis TaxID=45351 RepID=UPI00207741E5|nr:E3 ubiquitin-protein ligase RNF123 isoform X2 [Nematostella vectensis]